MDDAEQRNRLLDEMADAAFIHTDDRIVYCNPALVGLVGAAGAEALLGKPPLSIFHPRHHDLIRRRLAAREDPRTVVTDPAGTYFGALLSERTLVPADGALLATATFEDWLAVPANAA